MGITKAKFKGHRCFVEEWAGFDEIKPINVIIGRNNTGKSHLLDLVTSLCDKSLNTTWQYFFSGKLATGDLQNIFRMDEWQTELGGNSWADHGSLLVGKTLEWELIAGEVQNLRTVPATAIHSRFGSDSTQQRIARLKIVAARARHVLTGKSVRHLAADRDIRPEAADLGLNLGRDGQGATNIIRRNILSSKFSREIIQIDLLRDLNEIFGPDGHFSEIQVRVHDESHGVANANGLWEVFLGQESKGLVPLTNSGSGLKTVILVLLNLLAMPQIEGAKKSNFVFLFEELENNLHPALTRRLFKYLENYAKKNDSTIFLTTHSSSALDVFGVSPSAQIIHVTHDGKSARANIVNAHFDKLGVVTELGARPSDLLQANGIIWVEGPSDCIYLKCWIELFTDGELREGRDFICAFYGGALLARTQIEDPSKAEEEFVNLVSINSNVAVICDGDRTSKVGKGSQLKPRVRKIQEDVGKFSKAYLWITTPKEIESYIPGSIFCQAFGKASVPDPGQFELMFPSASEKKRGQSFVEKHLSGSTFDKVEAASILAPLMTKEALEKRFDWHERMEGLVQRIRAWNA